ncbi:carboxymuconolactone decarboxylase family protein [Mesorhizobium sp. 2RAF21]|uniref:carboxymuconolactone decarboxylase family protein n=1 Tax=Mesorhizobium sp. 2RAF21 TaxID=3232995 RepID=UPI003F9AD3A1
MSSKPNKPLYAGQYDIFGGVPEKVEKRWELNQALKREEINETIEALRKSTIFQNPLGTKVQQLVHFGQVLVLGKLDSATAHARAARGLGATLEELAGVVETALLTGGLATYAFGMDILGILFEEENGNPR